MNKSEVDLADLSDALVMHCAEMKQIRSGVVDIGNYLNILTGFFVFACCCNFLGIVWLIVSGM